MLSVEFVIQSNEVPALKIAQAGGKPGIFFSLKSSALDYSAAASSPMGTLAKNRSRRGFDRWTLKMSLRASSAG